MAFFFFLVCIFGLLFNDRFLIRRRLIEIPFYVIFRLKCIRLHNNFRLRRKPNIHTVCSRRFNSFGVNGFGVFLLFFWKFTSTQWV